MDTQKNLPPPVPAVWPTLVFDDVDAGVHLLTDVLGFVVTALHRGEDGIVMHAEARSPDGGGVMFGSRGRPGDWGTFGAQGVYVAVAESVTLEEIWDRVQAENGVEILAPLQDTDFGSRQFSFRDREGNLWSLGTYLGE